MQLANKKPVNPGELIKKLHRLQGAQVLIVGDIMLDEYLLGDASRISPEAPVPVVLVDEQRYMLGGAGNVARNISALGGRPKLISACGDGYNSGLLKELLAKEHIEADLTPLPGRPASTKTRVMARGQQLVRIDRENAEPLSQSDTNSILAKIEKLWPETEVIIISDYNKGLVSKEFMQGIEKIRAKNRKDVKLLVDPKTSNFPLYQNMFILTPNTLETGEGAGLPVRSKEEIIAAGQAIFSKIHCKHLLTTLGAKGMALFDGPNSILHIPTVAQKVFDVSGAGDTVIATLALALASNFELLEACVIANFAAGNVVAEVGAATTTAEHIAEAIANLGEVEITRWL
ncbi:PfkB family carbohydrate kinase [Desulfovibrio sp. OttesenSCG-928-F07]|nr:PfkB family carbohydrate kinase [Desulfovibrio sp. OttesenSCG-928-F07]